MITLVSGVPGAGKTTVARHLAERSSRSVQLDSDRIGEDFVVRGLVAPGGHPADEADRQLALRRRHLCLLAGSFAGDGFDVVIDDVVLWPGLFETYRALLVPHPWRFVVLAPRVEVSEARDHAREKHVFGSWRHLDAELRTWTDQPGLRLDTSDLTVEETVQAVLDAADAALVAAP